MYITDKQFVTTEEKERLLGFLRGNDFAHPGEAQAIDLIFDDIQKDHNRSILDIGCGIGGTAQYIQMHGYGKVTAIDRNQGVIQTAKKRHPCVQFIHCDVADVAKQLAGEKFDVICLISSFFYFTDQAQALKNIKALSHENTMIKIFEYTDLTLGKEKLMLNGDQDESHFSPIRMDTIAALLASSGFTMNQIIPLNNEFTNWYRELCTKIIANQSHIIERFSMQAYEWAESIYQGILASLEQGKMGGALVHAMPIFQGQ